MFRLIDRPQSECVTHHQGIPVRVYTGDVQDERIRASKDTVAIALSEIGRRAHIIELCCGTADICGPFAEQHKVLGIDCNVGAIEKARERFIEGIFMVGEVEKATPALFDVLILCETLEHIDKPFKLVTDWLPSCRYSVISHPIDEPMGSGESGGDHCWSYSDGDFDHWFKLGGHELIFNREIRVGGYRIRIGLGKRL